MKHILFFTPFAYINGSGILLWQILEQFDRSQLKATVFCDKPGPLFARTPADVAVYTSPFETSRPRRFLRKAINAAGYKVYERYIEQLHHRLKPDYWYLNTVLMFHLMPLAERLGVRVIVQLNELNSLYETVPYQIMKQAMTRSALVIGITQQICEQARQMGATQTALQYCYTSALQEQPALNPTLSLSLRQTLRIANDTFVWLMVGTPIHRKGIDFIPAIARALADDPCHIIWMGAGAVNTGLNYLVESQLAYFGLRNVSLIDVQTRDYYAYVSMADGILLTSREEPFGNTLIDAATLGKPIVASGEYGASEFVLPGMGILVDYAAPDQFVAAMRAAMAQPEQYNRPLAMQQGASLSATEQIRKWQAIINDLP